jgi:dCMP deaminase
MTALVAYVPVIHRGYLDWLAKYPNAKVGVLSDEFPEISEVMRKDVRSVSPDVIASMLSCRRNSVTVVGRDTLRWWANKKLRFVMPHEDVSHSIAREYLPGVPVEFDNVFLRYDSRRVLAKEAIEAKHPPINDPSIRALMEIAQHEAGKSPDWWRHVGAVLVKDGAVVLVGHNRSVRGEHNVLSLGDPRGCFSKGVHVDLTNSIHAEISVFAEALKRGISTSESDLYVTTFPCPFCANLIARAGIRRLFFLEGYSVLEGVAKLEESGIEIFRVPL